MGRGSAPRGRGARGHGLALGMAQPYRASAPLAGERAIPRCHSAPGEENAEREAGGETPAARRAPPAHGSGRQVGTVTQAQGERGETGGARERGSEQTHLFSRSSLLATRCRDKRGWRDREGRSEGERSRGIVPHLHTAA